jgi:hypothetical protein
LLDEIHTGSCKVIEAPPSETSRTVQRTLVRG